MREEFNAKKAQWDNEKGAIGKVQKLREDLEEVRRVRSTQRQRRQKNENPGGGHCGLYQRGQVHAAEPPDRGGIPANNRLFDTLDTTSRLLTVSDTLDVVISDTVGSSASCPTIWWRPSRPPWRSCLLPTCFST